MDRLGDDGEQVEGVTPEQVARAKEIFGTMHLDWPNEANWFLCFALGSAQPAALSVSLGQNMTAMFIVGWTLRGMVEREEVVL